MPIIETAHGPVDVFNWGYQLQGSNGSPLSVPPLVRAAHDLLVIDYSRDGTGALAFSRANISAMANGSGGEKVMVSYISIGEASDFRDLWEPSWTSNGLSTGTNTAEAPHWLGPTNPDWPESRKVRYWEEGWQTQIFNDQKTGWLDKIVSQGFDAAYLDIVDAYYFWAVEATAAQRLPGDPASERNAAQRMIDFIVAMTEHARETNPNFFVILQNGDFIIDELAGTDPARKRALLDAIGGIAVEDVYFGGDRDENNPFRPDEERIAALQRDFLGNGKFVLSVDYINTPAKISQFIGAAVEDGFMPFVAPDRDLDELTAPRGTKLASELSDIIFGTTAANSINALAGSDTVNGLAGNDTILGGAGLDRLYGGLGADTLHGGSANDTLGGGAGNDRLTGATGSDRFVFAPGGGRDIVQDFHNGEDKLYLKGHAANFAQVRSHATDAGGHLELNFGFERLTVFGLTRATLSADDVILV